MGSPPFEFLAKSQPILKMTIEIRIHNRDGMWTLFSTKEASFTVDIVITLSKAKYSSSTMIHYGTYQVNRIIWDTQFSSINRIQKKIKSHYTIDQM